MGAGPERLKLTVADWPDWSVDGLMPYELIVTDEEAAGTTVIVVLRAGPFKPA